MTKQSGFTLVELAIVLMIIGLLIGGILKGQELISNARTTNTIRQVKSYHAAYITFQDSYNALPGDMLSPSTRLPNCTTAPCNIAGNGDSKIDTDEEMIYFWLHMAKANLITGIDTSYTAIAETAGIDLPATPFGSMFRTGTAGNEIYFYTGYIVPLNNAAQIDRKMDDGIRNRGKVYADDCDPGPITVDYGGDPSNKCVMYFHF